MIANYHTHTWRCNHAVDTEEAYVRCAIDRGLELLGFSDHAPYCFPEGYYSRFRMKPELLSGYVQTVQDLKRAYTGQIDIRLGLEIEYYPAYFSQLLPVLQEQGIEYLLLGQHYIGNEIGEPYSGKETQDETVLRRYCDQIIDALQTGLFTYIAHPDLVHFTGDRKTYRSHMRRLCREAKSCGVPVEMNLLGFREGRHYPNRRFWEVAAEEGCQVKIGIDAHSPNALRSLEAEQQAMKLVRELDLDLTETVELKRII